MPLRPRSLAVLVLLSVLAALAAELTLLSGRGASAAPLAFRKTVVVRGLDSPVDVASTPTRPATLYVVEQRGTIRVVVRGKLQPGFFLDIRSLVQSGGEQGLLGLVFDPRYSSNRFVYVNYTDTRGNTRVVRYRTDGTRVLPATARELLEVDQPYSNYNGGDLVFGPDGGLYIGMGDGGSAGDPRGYAQDPSSLLGKMLRLDVRRPGSRPVIVAGGLRNPWRYSFDRKTGDLYIGDVGQNEVEEVDVRPRGTTDLVNYGWNLYEGTQGFSDNPQGPGRLVFPVFEYHHVSGNCTVIGGFAYRGAALAAERGRYVFGDFCSGRIWSFRLVGGKATAVRVEPFRIPGLTLFGESAAGELYAVASNGVLYRLS